MYTYVTDIVIAINPYKYYPHLCTLPDRPFRYGEEGVKCAPHVWSIGHTSFHGLVSERVAYAHTHTHTHTHMYMYMLISNICILFF